MQIADNRVVSFHYTLTNEDGVMIDSSKDQEPLEYLHGHHNLIPGLEDALADKAVGAKFSVRLDPEDAYGPYEQNLVKTVPRADFAEGGDLQLGMQFHMNLDGEPREVIVVELAEDRVTLDANHPLAGETLLFDIEVMGIRDATQEELSHGHVHSHAHH